MTSNVIQQPAPPGAPVPDAFGLARTSDQKLRRCAAALGAMERRFRRVKGYRHLSVQTRWGVLGAIGMAATVVACQRTHPVPQPAAIATAVASVPVEPPDSEPSWLYADSNLTSDPRLAWRFVRGTIMLRFRPGTAQSGRQAAVDTIRGRVVGGIRFRGRPGDGLYIVQVPAGENNAALFEAIALLNRLPQVDTAYPRTVIAGGA